jgi:hypothetical protein
MQLNNGRQNYGEKLPPVATDLIQVLQESDTALQLLKGQSLVFAMSTNMTLTITNASAVAVVAEEDAPAAEGDAVVENVEAV